MFNSTRFDKTYRNNSYSHSKKARLAYRYIGKKGRIDHNFMSYY